MKLATSCWERTGDLADNGSLIHNRRHMIDFTMSNEIQYYKIYSHEFQKV